VSSQVEDMSNWCDELSCSFAEIETDWSERIRF
jgi:hypothetical protein